MLRYLLRFILNSHVFHSSSCFIFTQKYNKTNKGLLENFLKLQTDNDNSFVYCQMYPLGGKTDIYDKYQEFCVPYEEADWTGLTLEASYFFLAYFLFIQRSLLINCIRKVTGKAC